MRRSGINVPSPSSLRVQKIVLGNVEIDVQTAARDLFLSTSQTRADQVHVDLTNFTGRLTLTTTEVSPQVATATVATGSWFSSRQQHEETPQTIHVAAPSREDPSMSFFTAVQPQLPGDDGTSCRASVGQLDNSDCSVRISDSSTGLGSELHGLCSTTTVQLFTLDSCLQSNPHWAVTVDANGRLPLHILCNNEFLLSTDTGRYTADVFGRELLMQHQLALVQRDEQGQLPCFPLIHAWVERCCSSIKDSDDESKEPMLPEHAASEANETAPPAGKQDSKVADVPANNAIEMNKTTAWCLDFLSHGMDLYAGVNTTRHSRRRLFSHTSQRKLRHEMARALVTLTPRLISTILLIDNDYDRNRILNLSMVERAMFCQDAVGPWLMELLKKKGVPSKRAVDFLVLISRMTAHDFIGGFRTPHSDDVDAYETERNAIFTKLGEMRDLIPALFVLDEKDMERAATSPAIWHVLRESLARPFVIGMVVMEFILHITLMLSFRFAVIIRADASGVLTGSAIPRTLVTAITSFFVTRKIVEALALLSVSPHALRGYFSEFWNMFDLLAIVLVIVVGAVPNTPPVLNAVVLALLWAKIVAFLRAVNIQMATFIQALFQIVVDIRFFVIVLLVVVMMFGDMFTIIYTTTGGDEQTLCNGESDPQEDFCTGSAVDSYLRMYAVLIGDFELNDYRDHRVTTILFIIFTVFGVIIMLNVLIAVVSDSYERSTLISTNLFGRARLTFLVHTIALEEFLRPDGGNNPLGLKGFLGIASRVLRWCVLLALVGVGIFADVFLVGQAVFATVNSNGSGKILVAILLIVMSFILTAALWVILGFVLSGVDKNRPVVRLVSPVISRINIVMQFCIHHILNTVFGDFLCEEQDEDEWQGRLGYIEKVVEKTVSDAKDELNRAIRTADANLKANETTLRCAETHP